MHSHAVPMALVAILALAVRLWLLGVVDNYTGYGGMSTHFGVAAEYVSRGDGYAISRSLSHELDREQAREGRLIDLEEVRDRVPDDEVPTLERPPGYSALLAVTYLATGEHRYAPLLVIQALLDTVTAVLVYVLARRFGAAAGLTAGIVYALWPAMARNSVLALPESLVPFVIVSSILLAFAAFERRTWPLAAAAGLTTAAAAYLRPEFLAFWILLAPAVFLAYGRSRAIALRLVLIAAVPLAAAAPWLVRNEAVTGHLVYSADLGVTLWSGLGEYPNRWGATQAAYLAQDEAIRQGITDVTEQELYFREKWWSAVREDPLFYAGTVLHRTWRYLTARTDWGFGRLYPLWPTYEDYTRAGKGIVDYAFEQPIATAIRALPVAGDLALLVLAAAGATIAWRSGRREGIVLLAVPLQSIVVHAPIQFDPRLLTPWLATVPVLAAIPLERAYRRARSMRQSIPRKG